MRRMGPPYRGNLFKNRHTPYGLRGEGSTLELPNFNLKFQKKNSLSYLWTKLWNSLPSQVRVSRDVNDFKSKLQDCSILEGVLQSSCHVYSYLIVLFSLGVSFLYFMYLLLVFIYLLSCLIVEWHYLLAVITMDLIYTRSYFERVLRSCLFPTNANKVFCKK